MQSWRKRWERIREERSGGGDSSFPIQRAEWRAACLLCVALGCTSLFAARSRDDPTVKHVFEDLSAAEAFAQTNIRLAGDVSAIADARRLIQQADYNTLSLSFGESTVGSLYAKAGNFSAALPHFREACRLADAVAVEEALEDQRTLVRFNSRGLLLPVAIFAGNFDEALQLAGEIQKLMRTTPDLDVVPVLNSLVEIETEALAKGEKPRARACKWVRDLLATGEAGAAWKIHRLADVAAEHLFLGEYEIALTNAEAAHRLLALHPAGKKYAMALSVLRTEGTVQLRLADPEAALNVFKEGKELIGGLAEPDALVSKFELATFHARMAIAEIMLGLTNETDVSIESGFAAAKPFDGLAEYLRLPRLRAQNRLLAAGGKRDEGLRIAREIMLEIDDRAGAWIVGLQRELSSAEFSRLLKESPDILALASREDKIQIYSHLADALRDRGDEHAAIDNYIAAIKLIEEGRIEAKHAEALPLFFSSYVDIYDHAIDALFKRSANSSDPEPNVKSYGRTYAEAALYFAEAAHARQQSELYGDALLTSFGMRAGLPPEVRERERKLREELGRTLEPGVGSLGMGDPIVARLQSENAAKAYCEFLDSTTEKHPEYATLAFPRPLKPSELPSSLNSTFILLYKVTDSAVFWWLIYDQKVTTFDRVPIDRRLLREKVVNSVEWIDENFPDAVATIGRGPFARIEAIPRAKADVPPRVIVVPDDVLCRLPYEAMRDVQGRYLGERFIIAYAPSLTVLAQSAITSRSAGPKTALLLGNIQDATVVVTVDGKPQSFKPFTKDFTKIMSSLTNHGYQAVLREHAQAAPEFLFTPNVLDYSIIHVDGHAFAESRNPVPFLVLHPSAGNPLGLLKLNDIATMRLKARLVVLSACQTGLGKRRVPLAGEGVEGLARMFMTAGSKSVLVSLWKIQDDHVAALMEHFYRELATGAQDEAVALFRAKTKLRNGAFKEPSMWAPFILVGSSVEPAPEDRQHDAQRSGANDRVVAPKNEMNLQDAKAAYERNDYTVAFTKFKTLAENKNPAAQYAVGRMYENGNGVAEDEGEAVRWYRAAAGQGYAFAQDKLGGLYANGGDGLPQNTGEALRWFGLAVAQGCASAQRNLGVLYVTGNGVSQDPKEAMRLFQLAAAQGDARACFFIGNLYSSGLGVTLDVPEALRWYVKAAELGLAEAQYNVGVMYAKAKGVPQDYEKAFQWFSKGAEQGDIGSLYFVGSMQIEGHGTPKNHVAACAYLMLAAQEGYERAKAELLFLRAKMSAEEVTQAEALAAKWSPKRKKDVPW